MRNRLLSGSFLALVVAVFCQSPAEGADDRELTGISTITIEVGMLSARSMQEGDLVWMLPQIQAFDRSRPDIDVLTINVGEPKRDQLPIYDHPGLPKNVLTLFSLPGYEPMYLSVRGDIVPVDSFLPDPDFDIGAFYESTLEPVTYAGKVWGVPWSQEVRLLLCDMDMFEATGFSEPPKTWDQLVDMAVAFTKDTNGDGRAEQVGFNFPTIEGNGYEDASLLDDLILTMVMQKGGSFITENGIDVNDPVFRDVLKFVQENLSRIWPPPPANAGVLQDPLQNNVIKPGTCAMYYTRNKRLPSFAASGGRWRVAKLPTWGEDIQANFGTYYLAVRKSTPEEERASWEFIKWITRADAPLPRDPGTGFSCRRDFVEREDFKVMESQPLVGLRTTYTDVDRLRDWGPRNVKGRYEALRLFFSRYFKPALLGQMPMEEALTKGAEEANKLMMTLHDPDQGGLYVLYK